MRVLKYMAPKREAKSSAKSHIFHRHADHAFYGWVVLFSLRCSADWWCVNQQLKLNHGKCFLSLLLR
jgi:hypothetical protein